MDDLISRQDAIRVLNAKCKKAFNLTCGEEDCACLEYTALRDMPSAQKKGHWIYPTDVKGFCRCEWCGALWGRDLYENRFFKYCPRCGSDMRGEEDG